MYIFQRSFVLPLLLGLNACGANSSQTLESDVLISNPSPNNVPDFIAKSTVAIRMADGSECSGAIVSKTQILTAEHCVHLLTNSNGISIGFGKNAANPTVSLKANGKLRKHPKNDLAVIGVNQIPKGWQAIPIFGPEVRLKSKDQVVVAGFGYQSEDNGERDYDLHWGKTNFVKFLDKWSYPGNYNYTSFLYFNAEGVNGEIDYSTSGVCEGDSGGPVFRQANKIWGLTGIISGGVCKFNRPEVLTADPRPLRDWILRPL